jgi:hypothetical protein
MSMKLLKHTLMSGFTMAALAVGAPAVATSYVTASQTQGVAPSTGPVTIAVNCPTGYSVTGGGYTETNPNTGNGGGGTAYLTVNNGMGYIIDSYFAVFANQPTANGAGWQVTGMTEHIDGATVTVYARCASPV